VEQQWRQPAGPIRVLGCRRSRGQARGVRVLAAPHEGGEEVVPRGALPGNMADEKRVPAREIGYSDTVTQEGGSE